MSPTSSESPVRTGACLCKRITFETRGKECNFILCHCYSCRRNCGTVYTANAWFKKSQYKILTGADLLRQHDDADTDTGGVVNRWFCSNCGSSMLVGSYRVPDMAIVPSGLFDGENHEWAPVWEQFAKRRVCFVDAVRGTRVYEGRPVADELDNGNEAASTE